MPRCSAAASRRASRAKGASRALAGARPAWAAAGARGRVRSGDGRRRAVADPRDAKDGASF